MAFKILKKGGSRRQGSIILALALLLYVVIFSNFVSAAITAYWKMDEGAGVTTTNDTLEIYNGTLVNAGWTAQGLLKNATTYNNKNQAFVNMTLPIYQFNTSLSMSMSLWVKKNTTGEMSIISQSNPYTNWQGLNLKFISGEYLEWKFGSSDVAGSNSLNTLTTTDNFTALGTWYHIALTYSNNGNITKLYVNGILKASDLTGINTSGSSNASRMMFGAWFNREGVSAYFFNGTIDEVGIFDKELTSDEVSYLYNSGAGRSYESITFGQTSVTVNLLSPANTSLFSTATLNFSSNCSAVAYNFTNATIFVWNTTGIFNKTYNGTIRGEYNQTNWTIQGFSMGSYYWNVYACADNETGTLCNWGGNRSLDIGANITGESYNYSVYETSTQTFQINISLFPGTNLYGAYLIWNGTSYAVSNILAEGDNRTLTKTIDIPLNPFPFQNATINLFWAFIFSNLGQVQQNTSSHPQNVSYINFQMCNATYSNTTLNITIRQEKNPNPLLNASFHSVWHYWLGGGSVKKNYTFEYTLENFSNYTFCKTPSLEIFHINSDIEYEAKDYNPRTKYFKNATLSSIIQEIDLFLINNTDSVKFFFTLKRALTVVPDVIVTISKYDVGMGKWVGIGVRKSDNLGQFIEYLELDKEYRFYITDINGVFLGQLEKTAICSSAPCKITLELEEALTNLWAGYYDAFASNVAYNLSYNPYTKMFTYTFIDLSGLAQYFRLEVRKIEYNQTGALICNKTLYSTLGELDCNLNGNSSGQYMARGYIARSPEKLVAIVMAIFQAISEAIGKSESLFFAFLLVVVVGLVGAWNPVIGIILSSVAFFFSVVVGFVSVSYVTIVLVFILAIFLIVKLGRTGVGV